MSAGVYGDDPQGEDFRALVAVDERSKDRFLGPGLGLRLGGFIGVMSDDHEITLRDIERELYTSLSSVINGRTGTKGTFLSKK